MKTLNANDGKEVVDNHEEKSNINQSWNQHDCGACDVTVTTL